jgi:uncharacterized protein YceH (UPF0502 family)
MKLELSAQEARVVGCLIEKQITTPDQYPLSLNALRNACNQTSNRDPLMSLDERETQAIVDGLVRKSVVMERSGFGSRVPKYQQRFCNMEFSELKFTPQQTAIVCELLLRGPQTPGELRTRASRMAPMTDVSEVEAALQTLERYEKRPLVQRLAREPGRRDSRYAQLFTGPVAESPVPSAGEPAALVAAAAPADDERLRRLEEEVRQLRDAVAELQSNARGTA